MGSVKKSNKGFSLVELMIAMIVSLLILAGLFYSVMGDMRSYESARSSQELVSKGRMALQTLRLYIQQAGFRDVTALKNETVFSAGTSYVGGTWEYGQVVQGMTSSGEIDDEKADSDILVVRFLGATEIGIVSCVGDDLDENTSNEVTLYVNTSNQLMCKDNDDGAEVLDEGVEFLEVLYGTEDDYRYFTASEVTDWADVNRVKVGLLLSTEVSAHGLTNSNSYTIFNQTIDAANDTNYRSVVMETVLIGNQGG
ncbi:PilW family protein [uncultured Psychromonas sp.]|uniref:PilW family protein n=1 Tax=uncultured Psychromonas sp. TaxID=173974 RepID=UPI002605A09B|nr:PilW family protein [uncultured Psychromonas sp.]